MKKLVLWASLGGAAALCAPWVQAGPDATWTQPQKPFRIYGNSWYVGTRGLGAVLITSPQGHVLIDATLPENARQIEANIEALGFRVKDVKLILNSHAHSDHAGAIAALAAASGASVSASEAGAKALMLGGNDPEDPQYGEAPKFPPVAKVGVVADGGSARVGDIAVQAHYTPGHTPGSTSWTWQSCEANRCLHMVYADSITAFSNDTYRYSNNAEHPHREQDFRKTFANVASLPCDILITPHPDASDFLDKVALRDQGKQPNPLVDAQACKTYAATGGVKLDKRLQQEKQGKH
ncbi:metallo-beta-lactamase class B [Dyella sp. OK004]|uniref:subclass B3 metallo-beta-lactamase n=1 Tax=Dyella sp. OK004 TaxID=1855292 RepID=UPI0008F41097|nr:subclass B3 metallo-beta-lactamase [Dyella sp. OK004]SFS13347.1 metallo-beta-lactamase class B [Dyella sp. OK004]